MEYRRSILRGFVVAAFVAQWAIWAHAQQPGPTKDPTPLARPHSLIAIKSEDPQKTLKDLKTLLSDSGFVVPSVDWDTCELTALRKDANNSGNYDQVIVWLERDMGAPTSKLRLYILYGRFEMFFGAPEPSRIKVDSAYEENKIGALKSALIDYATK